jgi:PAS domain S-box-containing protein
MLRLLVSTPRYRVLLFMALGIWTFACLVLFLSFQFKAEDMARRLSLAEAQMSFQKDVAYRRWVASVGGVYANADKVAPNPFLHVPNRDVSVGDGSRLTLVNPAYMTRLVHEFSDQRYGYRAKLTSLRPVNPLNAADAWEMKGFEALTHGAAEFSEETLVDGKPVLRFLGAFQVEPACLKCHGDQGYKVGDLRGALSINVPVDSQWRVAFSQLKNSNAQGLLLLWLVMGCGIVLGTGIYARSDHLKRLQEDRFRMEQLEARRLNEEKEQRLGWISRNLQLGYCRLDLEGRYQAVNEQMLRIHGYERGEEMIGRLAREHLSADSQIILRDGMATLARGELVFHPLVTHLRKDGSQGWHATNAIPLYEGGVFAGADIFIMDLTAPMRMRQEIVNLLDHMNDGFALHEWIPAGKGTPWDYRFLMVNKAFEQMIGVKADDIVGQTASTLFPGQGSDLLVHFERVVLSGSSETFEYTHPPSGRVYSLRTFRPEAGRFACLITEITKSRELEGQMLRMQRLDSLGSLASGVAHDLNNILMPVLMGTDLIAETVRDPESKASLQLMKTSAQRGAALVKQLLLFGRGDKPQRRETKVDQIVEDVVQIIEETFPKAIEFKLTKAQGLWRLNCDPTQIYQLLLNLCVNARDAMPSGGTLELEVNNQPLDGREASRHPDAREGNYICFRVRDTGVGIPPELIDKIFDPFFTTKPKGKGTGLGLSMVIGIARSHEGFLTVESRPGKGAEFRVFLPALDSAAPDQSAGAAGEDLSGAGELILVVDDEDGIRRMLGAALTKMNYRVIEASDGATALNMYSSRGDSIAAVICDLMMPHMDGWGVIECIRKIRADLPILAISGVGPGSDARRQDLPRSVAFLQKPFELEEIMRALKLLLHPPRQG